MDTHYTGSLSFEAKSLSFSQNALVSLPRALMLELLPRTLLHPLCLPQSSLPIVGMSGSLNSYRIFYLICTPFYEDQKIRRKWKPGPQRHAVDNPLVTKDKFCYDKTIWYLVILKTSTVVRSALAAAFGRSVISLCGGGKKKIRGEGKDKIIELNVILMTPFHEGHYSNYHTATSL